VSETENENQVEESTEATDEAPAAEAETPPEPATEEPAATEAEEAEAPESDEPAPAAAEAEAAPAAPEKKQRSRKHVPRSERRQRPKPKRAESTGRKPITRLPKPEHERGRRQERRGVVVSNAMDKTIVVKVDVVKMHQRYKKVIRRSQKFHAHDEQNQANVGDVVRIVETRPLSKTKSWRLAEVVEVAK
jgi:small subunit ribosomal protein S17